MLQIIDVDTRISNKQLVIDIFLDRDAKPLRLNFESLHRALFGIKSFEIEYLIGMTVELIDHRQNYYFERAYKISFCKPLSQIRVENEVSNQYQIISSVKVSHKNPQKPFVIIKTEGNNLYFDKLDNFCSRVDLEEHYLYLLEGVSIAPIMFKKGEYSNYNGRFYHIKNDNKIVKKWNFSFDIPLSKNYIKYISSRPMPNLNYENPRSAKSYEKYGGYNEWDDDTIDDVFNGDPDATWNID